jgi:hypothetical protein
MKYNGLSIMANHTGLDHYVQEICGLIKIRVLKLTETEVEGRTTAWRAGWSEQTGVLAPSESPDCGRRALAGRTFNLSTIRFQCLEGGKLSCVLKDTKGRNPTKCHYRAKVPQPRSNFPAA